jgi:hypothetical protein
MPVNVAGNYFDILADYAGWLHMLSAYAANATCMTVLAMQYNLTLLDLWIC